MFKEISAASNSAPHSFRLRLRMKAVAVAAGTEVAPGQMSGRPLTGMIWQYVHWFRQKSQKRMARRDVSRCTIMLA